MKKRTVITTETHEVWIIHQPGEAKAAVDEEHGMVTASDSEPVDGDRESDNVPNAESPKG
jgi:hypothetical protein